jgi:hypothetical protein
MYTTLLSVVRVVWRRSDHARFEVIGKRAGPRRSSGSRRCPGRVRASSRAGSTLNKELSPEYQERGLAVNSTKVMGPSAAGDVGPRSRNRDGPPVWLPLNLCTSPSHLNNVPKIRPFRQKVQNLLVRLSARTKSQVYDEESRSLPANSFGTHTLHLVIRGLAGRVRDDSIVRSHSQRRATSGSTWIARRAGM